MVLQRVSQSVLLRNKTRSCYKQNGCGCYGLSTAPHISRSRNKKFTHIFSSDYCESKAMTVVWDILLTAASEMQIRASAMWGNHLHYILWNAMQVTAIQRNWTAHFAAQCSLSAQCTTKQCIVLRLQRFQEVGGERKSRPIHARSKGWSWWWRLSSLSL